MYAVVKTGGLQVRVTPGTAVRVGKLAGEVGAAIEFSEVLLVGGVARNVGFAESLKRELDTEIFIPENPETVSAYGAALLAAET